MNANLQSKFNPLTPEAKAFVEGVGRALREARQQRGEDLHDIAAFLRIKPAFLDALEAGAYDVFPGRAYAYGFLRSYADYLGFDGAEVVRRVKQVTEPQALQPRGTPPAAWHRRIGYAASGLALTAAALLVLWQGFEHVGVNVFNDSAGVVAPANQAQPTEDKAQLAATRPLPDARLDAERGASDRVSRIAEPRPASSPGTLTPVVLPEKLRASERVPPVSVRGRGPDSQPAVGRTIDAALPGNGTSALAAEVPQLRDGATVGTAAALAGRVNSPLGNAADAPHAGGGLKIVARESSWVQIRSRDGSYVRTRTLAPGESYTVPERDDLLIWAGDAGAVELSIDGHRLGPLGAPGTVVRDYPLDPRQLRQQLSQR